MKGEHKADLSMVKRDQGWSSDLCIRTCSGRKLKLRVDKSGIWSISAECTVL
jgi:hypothetical protein